MKIKSKTLGKTLTFSRPGSYYLYVDINGHPGTLGMQLCTGGSLHGSTIGCRGEWQRVCKKWYRAYIRGLA